MLLSDRHIHEAIAAGRLGISPYEPDTMLQPASIDVRLDDEFLVYNSHRYGYIDPALEQEGLTRRVRTVGGEAFVLHPGEFVLASTFEEVRMGDDLAARLEGKSSLGRLGLVTHSTAGFIDPGFHGHITLELSNSATLPLLLWPGMKVGQLCLIEMSGPAEHPYGSAVRGSRYQGQRGPTASRSWKNFHRTVLPR